jgi:outer membrane protein OmpA-like peptidoglycan-associated protein
MPKLTFVLAALVALAPSAHAGKAPIPDFAPVPAGFRLEFGDHQRYAGFEVHHPDMIYGESYLLWVYGDRNKLTTELWAKTVEAAGWTVKEKSNRVVATKMIAGHTAWLFVALYKETLLIEKPAPVIELTPPGATPEPFDPPKDFPYFTPLPTTKLHDMHASTDAMAISVSGPPTFAGPPVWDANYDDADLSAYEIVAAYKPALEKAGWKLLQSDGVILAHYTKNGRDLWLHAGARGNGMNVKVVDMGAAAAWKKLQEQLDQAGHVAVYGIYFATDSDALDATSDATLQQIKKLLDGVPALKLEIQGHTDSTGKHDHNQTLSDARAAAVKKWLVEHGVAAARLTTKGYAETVPVGDNSKPEGRSKNRRVELARLK